ncbi:hypothetical protein GmHk_19G056368 [Glycine max]|nr:hypothetical protein GmHk_19G056368 [Glycine max]
MTMSITLLLQANPSHLKWNQLPSLPRRTRPDRFTPIPDSKRRVSSVKCISSSRKPDNTFSLQSPWEVLASTVSNTLKALKKPAIAAVLVGLLLMYDPTCAFAASGGRMGGRSFSSSSSSSRSYSVPRTSSSGFSFSAPYYGPSPFGGVYVGPAVGVGVGAGSSFFLILVGFLAFVLVSGFLSDRSEGSVLTAADKTTVLKLQLHGCACVSEPKVTGPWYVVVVLVGFRIRRLLLLVGLLGMGRTLQRDLNRIAEVADTSTSEGLHYVLTETTLALLRHPDYCISAYSSVAFRLYCFHVGHQSRDHLLEPLLPLMASPPHTFQWIQCTAQAGSTTNKPALHHWNLLQDSILSSKVGALIRVHRNLVDIKRGIEDGEKRFNQLSIEERGKFDEETLVNVNNIKRQSTRSQRANGFSNEYIVITILAAAEGEHKLPSINGSGDLKEALQKLGSIPSSRLLAVEVLWTPQNENDTLSERELLEDYPLLRPL